MVGRTYDSGGMGRRHLLVVRHYWIQRADTRQQLLDQRLRRHGISHIKIIPGCHLSAGYDTPRPLTTAEQLPMEALDYLAVGEPAVVE